MKFDFMKIGQKREIYGYGFVENDTKVAQKPKIIFKKSQVIDFIYFPTSDKKQIVNFLVNWDVSGKTGFFRNGDNLSKREINKGNKRIDGFGDFLRLLIGTVDSLNDIPLLFPRQPGPLFLLPELAGGTTGGRGAMSLSPRLSSYIHFLNKQAIKRKEWL